MPNHNMRITSIYIKEFKNIKEQTLQIDSSSHYCALIGINGSGKSNWLEAISLFLQGMYTKKEIPFEYIIEYEIDGKRYKRQKSHAYINDLQVRNESMRYPKVIACYSGEETRLWQDAFEMYYMTYFNKAIKNIISEPEMLYLNKYSWNLALLALMCSENNEEKIFLKDYIGIDDLSQIEIEFRINTKRLDRYQENDVKVLLNRLKPDGNGLAKVAMSELATYDINAKNNAEFCRKMFNFLYLASMPKANGINKIDKVIERIDIKLQNKTSLRELSEGEKKLILINCITKILADDTTIILLDEPDAHVHIGHKYNIIKTFSTFKGQIILTTHSPSLCKFMEPKAIVRTEQGTIKPVANELDAGKYLADNNDILRLLFSINHIVITEGKTDCQYIKKAIELYSNEYPELVDIEFISVGGTDGDVVKEFLTKIREIEGRKIIVLVDRDTAGENCANKLLQKREKLLKKNINCEIIDKDREQYFLMIPPLKADQSDFLIEDYFGREKIKELALKCIEKHYGENVSLNSFPKVKDKIKCDDLKVFCSTATKKDMKGFLPLLDKLKEIIKVKNNTKN